MDNHHPDTHQSDTEALAAMRATARTTSHDAKNAIGIIWLHLSMLDRKSDAAANPDVREAIEGVKEETRQLVRLMDELSEQAKRGAATPSA